MKLRIHLITVTAVLLATANLHAFRNNLLFSEEDLPRIRANTENPVFAAYWQELLEKDVEEDGDFLREAFIYVVTGEESRVKAAKKHALKMAREESWNLFQDADGTPIGFLRTAAKTRSMALVYDWLYDHFTQEERAEIRRAIADKGCQPMYNALYGMKHPESVIRWEYTPESPYKAPYMDLSRWPEILSRNNFRAVINGGLALGVATLMEEDERAGEWKGILLESIPQFNALFKDDGSYDEAVAYVNYAMKFQIHAMEVANRKFGIDFYDTANFTGMIDYILAMYMPSYHDRHGSVTFGDAGSSLQSSAPFWIAGKSRDGLAQYVGLHFAGHYWQTFLYFDPSVEPVPPVEGTRLDELDLDWIIARTGYGLDDLVVAMRSGEPMNHEHGDRNSLLLKAYGELLLPDPGKVTYDARSPEWILRTAQGHNMLLVDGEGVQYHKGEEGTNASLSSAKIVRAGNRRGYLFWASDATPGYQVVNPDIASVTRTVVLFPSAPCLVVLDKVRKQTEPSDIATRWHLENRDGAGTINIGPSRHFHFTRPNARLHTAFAGTVPLNAERGGFSFPDHPTEFQFVDVKAEEPAREVLLVTVATPLRKEEPDPVVELEQDGNEWLLHYHKSGSSIQMKIIDEGALPEFEILENAFVYERMP